MISKLKTELNAALVIGTGLVLASGYLVTWLRFENEDIAQTGVLSALPERFYLSVAIQNLAAPVAVLLTLGIVWLVLTVRLGPSDNLPRKLGWFGFGLVLAVVSALVALGLSPFEAEGPPYRGAVTAWALASAGLTTAFGTFARWRLRSLNREAVTAGAASADQGDQFVASATAVFLSCLVTAIGFVCIDARTKERALPGAVVFTDRDDCAEVKPAARATPGCPLAGFYVGESDKWLYLVEDNDASTPEIDSADPNLPGRVLFVPRDSVRQLRLDRDIAGPQPR